MARVMSQGVAVLAPWEHVASLGAVVRRDFRGALLDRFSPLCGTYDMIEV